MATAVTSVLALLPDAGQRRDLAAIDPGSGLVVHICANQGEADRLVQRIRPDVLLCGLANLPWLLAAHARDPDAFRILCAAPREMSEVVGAINRGEADALLREHAGAEEAVQLIHHGCEQALLRRHTRSLVDELAVRNADLLHFNERLEQLVAERTGHLLEAQERLKESQRRMIQLETQATMTHLLRGLAHEFNNPLAAIYGYAQRLRRQLAADPDLSGRLDIILKEIGFCRTVVSQLHQLATPLREAVTAIDPAGPFREACRALQETGMAIAPEVHGATAPVVAAPRALALAFQHVVANAVEAGATRIALTSSRIAQRTLIILANDGETPDIETCRNATRPFFTTRAASGHRGLGLSTAAALLGEQDGHIAVAPRAEGGTAVSITLPAPEPHPHSAGARREADIRTPLPAERMTLVVDDEPMVAEILVDVLHDSGLATATAGTYAEGIARLTQPDITALIVDLHLPDGSGLDLARRALAARPELHGRIVLVTGENDAERIQQLMVDTGFPVLGKPFHLAQVQALAAQLR